MNAEAETKNNTRKAIELTRGDKVLVGQETRTFESKFKHVEAGTTDVWCLHFQEGPVEGLFVHADRSFPLIEERKRTNVGGLSETKQVLWEMLTENTGRHFLDSGGAYGRSWERNQSRDFELEPESKLHFSFYTRGDEEEVDWNISLSTYHWLSNRLEYNERLDEVFRRWCARPRNEDKHWLALMEEFPEYLSRFGMECGGIYGEGKPMTINTYNGEDALDQTLQYTYFSLKGEDAGRHDGQTVILLQIHGGCDVRGGYTRPRAFLVDDEETSILDNARLSMCCDGSPHPNAKCPNKGQHLPFSEGSMACSLCDEGQEYHRWDSDNAGYDWNDVGDGNMSRELSNLKDIKSKRLENYQDWTPGTIWVLDEHTALCPACGGKLGVYPWP